jgi:hypothetical protein
MIASTPPTSTSSRPMWRRATSWRRGRCSGRWARAAVGRSTHPTFTSAYAMRASGTLTTIRSCSSASQARRWSRRPLPLCRRPGLLRGRSPHPTGRRPGFLRRGARPRPTSHPGASQLRRQRGPLRRPRPVIPRASRTRSRAVRRVRPRGPIPGPRPLCRLLEVRHPCRAAKHSGHQCPIAGRVPSSRLAGRRSRGPLDGPTHRDRTMASTWAGRSPAPDSPPPLPPSSFAPVVPTAGGPPRRFVPRPRRVRPGSGGCV